jgi:hypothetical protein
MRDQRLPQASVPWLDELILNPLHGSVQLGQNFYRRMGD